MTLRHLEIFLSVCDHKSMTQAARELHLSQPSVSQTIADLEAEYGVRLFERLNHRLKKVFTMNRPYSIDVP